MTRAQMIVWLRELEHWRKLLRETDQVIQTMTPEEKVVLQRMVISPDRGSAAKLCQMLEVEKSTLYRIRERVLNKLKEGLRGQEKKRRRGKAE